MALAVVLTVLIARGIVATLILTGRVTRFLCRLLRIFVVWAYDMSRGTEAMPFWALPLVSCLTHSDDLAPALSPNRYLPE